jgi:hypothetical protein
MLEGFLINTRYCRDEIGHREKQAAFLTLFTDYILMKNVQGWRNTEPFIMAGDLRSVWNSFSARLQSALIKKNRKRQPFFDNDHHTVERTAL